MYLQSFTPLLRGFTIIYNAPIYIYCYDSSPIYTYFLTLLTYDAPPESPYSSGPPTGPLEPMDQLMPNPYPN